jgi:hypothetical protein
MTQCSLLVASSAPLWNLSIQSSLQYLRIDGAGPRGFNVKSHAQEHLISCVLRIGLGHTLWSQCCVAKALATRSLKVCGRDTARPYAGVPHDGRGAGRSQTAGQCDCRNGLLADVVHAGEYAAAPTRVAAEWVDLLPSS